MSGKAKLGGVLPAAQAKQAGGTFFTVQGGLTEKLTTT